MLGRLRGYDQVADIYYLIYCQPGFFAWAARCEQAISTFARNASALFRMRMERQTGDPREGLPFKKNSENIKFTTWRGYRGPDGGKGRMRKGGTGDPNCETFQVPTFGRKTKEGPLPSSSNSSWVPPWTRSLKKLALAAVRMERALALA